VHVGEHCAFSPDGSVLAVPARRGTVHLVDWASGAGQVVASLKATSNRGIRGVLWDQRREGLLSVLGEDAAVYVWDVRSRRCVERWKDDSAYGARLLAGDPTGRYTAIG
jgi:U3 small nucleolar RNA-associated protein 18